MLDVCTRAGSLMVATRELARYKLELMRVQEFRWDKVATVRAGDYNFYYGIENANRQLGTGLCTPKNSISTYEIRVC
jgi:hypothetical protein